MDVIVGAIKDARKDSELDKLKKELNNRIEQIQKHANQLNAALSSLNYKNNTLGVIFLLYTKTLLPNVDAVFVSQVEALLKEFSVDQARKTPEKFGAVVHRYTEITRESNPAKGIPLLKKAIGKFRLGSDHLTPLHPDYVSLCLKSHNYKAALWLLQSRIFQVDPKRSGSTPRDLLLYYYYGSMVYIGLKQFNLAQEALSTVLHVPTNTITAISVEAFKKHILVSLIVQGKSPSLSSKSGASQIFRHLRTYASEYVNFGETYETNQVDKVSEYITKHTEVFQKDGNFGLVKQCLQALYRLNIQRLTQTYLTLSLKNIAETVGLKSAQEAEFRVLEMIDNGEIVASINQEAGMVEFKDKEQRFTSSATSRLLDTRVSNCAELATKLRNMDNDIASSNAFIARSHGLREEMLMELDRPSMASGRIGRVLDIFRT